MTNSWDRAERLVDWVLKYTRIYPDECLAPLFWSAVREEWAGFDLIPHWWIGSAFKRFAPWHSGDPLVVYNDPEATELDTGDWFHNLPEEFVAWRGQCETRDCGLAWTVDRETAVWFSSGFRWLKNEKPILLRTNFRKSDIAIATNEREEMEVVPFRIPTDFEKVVIAEN